MDKINLIEGFIWYLVFIFSTTLHEAAHAFMAYKMGDSTAYNAGQVTLNPRPHMKREPVGTIVVPVISFLLGGWMIGWASTPYNINWAFQYPKRAAAMAAAGPISNFLLVIISALLIHIGIMSGVLLRPESITLTTVVTATESGIFTGIATFLSIMFSLNLILFVFNLFPFPPLDGSGIIPMYLSDNAGRKYLNLIKNGAFSLIGILIAWNLFDYVYFKIHLVFINLLYWGSNYQ